MDFLDYLIGKLPFRIKYLYSGNGHEFRPKYHWHDEDCGIIHRYIKSACPHLNGMVERSRLTDKQDIYQLLNYTGDSILKRQFIGWETFYNYHRSYGSLMEKLPCETLKSKQAV